ncbi:hypothetical protein BGX31_010738 [Mortierella sp. GBA43]|nr:hypothetical protein BGX31_010738 [Mortierella sp. GBA43]
MSLLVSRDLDPTRRCQSLNRGSSNTIAILLWSMTAMLSLHRLMMITASAYRNSTRLKSHIPNNSLIDPTRVTLANDHPVRWNQTLDDP